MKESYYSKIERQIDSFPSLPTTVAEVMRVVNNPESSAKELTQAILPDQSMCVAILKIANSALYGRPKKVSSIETAIMVLGFNEIQNIVLSKSVLSSFAEKLHRDDDIIDTFWEHSFTCALAAKVIAEHLNLQPPGEYFIGGLIHDIGKLAMLLTLSDEYAVETWLTGFSTTEKLKKERELFGITHQEVAGKLLRKWSFPDKLTFGLEYHHNPEELTENQDFALILQVADAMSFLLCQHSREEERDQIEENFSISQQLQELLPGIVEKWKRYKLPWDELPVEMWYNWLEIEKKHGSSILSILSAQ